MDINQTFADKYSLAPRELAIFLNVSLATLGNWRREGVGPKFFHVGPRLIRYRMPEVMAYIAARTGEGEAQ